LTWSLHTVPSIVLDKVHLKFCPDRTRSSLRDWFANPLRSRPRLEPLTVHALQGISLHVRDGDRLGVVGHNGAGKSTLLKVLAGVYPPTAGSRQVDGRISSLFELTLGFELECNGWENIRFRGLLQGETPQAIRRMAHEIAEFSELGRFLDLPVRCYSSGMLVRLAFAIATAVQPEILLIDEVLSAGDQTFQVKARRRMEEMMARARLMVVVSHDLGSIQQLCTQAAWLHQGRIVALGAVESVLAAYQASAAAA